MLLSLENNDFASNEGSSLLLFVRISEERFWHNYFYRVFLIKQSSQLATLASGELSKNKVVTVIIYFVSNCKAEHKAETTEGEQANNVAI